VFTGRPARGIENEFIRALTPIADALPAFPLQHMITAPLRRAAAAAGDRELFHLWSGQGAPLGRELPAGELVRTILREAREAKSRIAL
jgi:nitronate monooxygenase